MRDGFVRANDVAPHAMDVDAVGARTTDGDAEADVRTADVCYQPQHRGAVELIALGIRAGGRCIDCHHCPLKKWRFEKDREACAPADNAVNNLGAEFYLVIDATVVRISRVWRPFDNAV